MEPELPGADYEEGFLLQPVVVNTTVQPPREERTLEQIQADIEVVEQAYNTIATMRNITPPQPPVEQSRALFSWTTRDGETVHSDIAPRAQDDTIVELVCRRNEKRLREEGYSRNESFPAHEAAMKALPCQLGVLRLTGCRIRTFPTLPKSIIEVYAEKCDFFHLPDLSSYTDLIVLELEDGRLEDLKGRLPPTLARCNVNGNALNHITLTDYPTSLPQVTAYTNPSDCKLSVTPAQYQERIHLHANAFHRQFVWTPGAARGIMRATAPGRPINEGRNIAHDNQNTHDTGVQNSTRANIQYLIGLNNVQYPKKTQSQLFAAIRQAYETPIVLTQPQAPLGFWKRVENFFSGIGTTAPIARPNPSHGPMIVKELESRFKSPYSMHATTPFSLTERIWARIEAFPPETRATALQRFVEEIEEAKRHCLNGYMVRMVNVLQGLDENIILKLLPRQIMQQRVPNTMRKMRAKGGWREGEEPWQWSRDCFVETCKDLDDCEEPFADRRREWLDPFYEGFVDELMNGYEPLPPEDPPQPVPSDTWYREVLAHKNAFVEKRFQELALPDEGWAKAETCNRLE